MSRCWGKVDELSEIWSVDDGEDSVIVVVRPRCDVWDGDVNDSIWGLDNDEPFEWGGLGGGEVGGVIDTSSSILVPSTWQIARTKWFK